MCSMSSMENQGFDTRLLIVEQPQGKNIRFRYKSEGPSHGGLQGEHNTRANRTYPTVQVVGYKGPVKITAFLVTNDSNAEDPKPHVHRLVGKNCENGICTVNLPQGPTDSMTATFMNLSIEHATRKNIVAILEERIIALRQSRSTQGCSAALNLTAAEREMIMKQAKRQSEKIELNIVKICFKAYIQDMHGNFEDNLGQPVLSDPIFDNKAAGSNPVKICRMSKGAGCCSGGDEVFLLCDKVQKDDISVVFYETDPMNTVTWEEQGKFGPSDVHRQSCIVFQTPPYWNLDIQQAINVKVQLRRKSNQGDISEPVTFTYYPQTDHEEIMRKRRKKIEFYKNSDIFIPVFRPGPNCNLMENHRPMYGGDPDAKQSRKATLPCFGQMDTSVGGLDSGLGSGLEVFSFQSTQSSFGGGAGRHGISKAELESNVQSDASSRISVIPSHIRKNDVSSKESTKKELQLSHWFERSVKLNDLPSAVARRDASVQTTDYEPDEFHKGDVPMALANRTSAALQKWVISGDVRHLVYTARYLIGTQDDDGDTVLGLAVMHDQKEISKMLIEVVQTIPDWDLLDAKNASGQTHLHLCTVQNNLPVLSHLLNAKADPSISDFEGNLPAHKAARSGKPIILEELLRYRCYTHSRTLTEKYWINYQNHEGLSILHEAVQSGNLKCVKLCVQAGIDVNLTDKNRKNALHKAVEMQHMRIITYLLTESDVDVDAVDLSGKTSLHIAVLAGNASIVSLIMNTEANPDLICQDIVSDCDEMMDEDEVGLGWTALRIASHYGYQKVVDVLRGDPSASHKKAIEKMLNEVQRDEETGKISSVTELSPPSSFVSVLKIQHERAVRVVDLSTDVWNKIAKLMDVDDVKEKNWKTLAFLLGFRDMEAQLLRDESPTKAILTLYGQRDGTIGFLTDILVQMGRMDVINVIQTNLPKSRNCAGTAMKRYGGGAKGQTKFSSKHIKSC